MDQNLATDESQLWSVEPTGDPHVRRARAHIGGLHCSLCTGTIERALGQMAGVRRVAVSLTHEQALVEFDSRANSAQALMVGRLTAVTVFGIAREMLGMAWQSLRRGILNQHVLVEVGAFAGLVGGGIGGVLQPAGYPTAVFFAVSVMVLTYRLFSEWLPLIVKTPFAPMPPRPSSGCRPWAFARLC